MAARSDTTPVPCIEQLTATMAKQMRSGTAEPLPASRPAPHRLRLKTVTASSRALLEDLFRAAVGAAHPANSLHPHLPAPPSSGRLLILAAGKAAGSMAEVAERHYLDERGLPASRIGGLAVTRHGYGRPTRVVRVVEAGHPVPDAAGVAATLETLAMADAAGADDLVLALISGGASANWIAPAAGLSLAEKQAVTRALLASGASIGEINAVRKHLSRIKGGRLARHAHPARVVSVGISDVPGDDPAVIGSGPTVPDRTTLADARAVVARYGLDLPGSSPRRSRTPPTRPRSPETPSSPPRRLRWRCDPPMCFVPSSRRSAPADMTASCSAPRSRGRPGTLPPTMRGWRANCRDRDAVP